MRVRPAPAAACCALAAVLAAPLAAQSPAPDLRNEAVVVASDAERYPRVPQVAGQVPLYPWSIRGFSPAEVDAFPSFLRLHDDVGENGMRGAGRVPEARNG
jgi:hypothetical protein